MKNFAEVGNTSIRIAAAKKLPARKEGGRYESNNR